MAHLYDILKSFTFLEEYRSEIVFSDSTKIRLDPIDHSFKLVLGSNELYSTDSDIWVMSPEFYPKSNKLWRAFEAFYILPENTSIQYRLHDGTDHRYWNGSTWAVAGTSDWNTENEITTNISSFPLGIIRIVFNLKTTDGIYTPTINEAKIGYGGQLNFFDDWLFRTLVPALKNNVTSYGRLPLEMSSTGTSIDLNSFTFEKNFQLSDIDSVYDHTNDPDHLIDLFSSYDSGTKIITLSASITSGDLAWINFTYQPNVIVVNSVDFEEVKTPALVIENIRMEEKISGYNNSIADKENNTALNYPPPIQNCMFGDVLVLGDGNVDTLYLTEALRLWAEENQSIRLNGTDEDADFILLEPYSQEPFPNLSDLRQGRLSFEFRNLWAWLRPAQETYSVSKIIITGDVDLEITG